MFGSAPFGSYPFGSVPADLHRNVAEGSRVADISVFALVIPEKKTSEGLLIASTSHLWAEIVTRLGNDWSVAREFNPRQWEEIIAGAFNKAGYEVTLTPRSGDHGRDVIATRLGVGCVKIIGSVKANAPGNLVSYDDVRALLGVMSGSPEVSKGIVATASDFPPKIEQDPFIKPFLPTRLELLNGAALQKWLRELNKSHNE